MLFGLIRHAHRIAGLVQETQQVLGDSILLADKYAEMDKDARALKAKAAQVYRNWRDLF